MNRWITWGLAFVVFSSVVSQTGLDLGFIGLGLLSLYLYFNRKNNEPKLFYKTNIEWAFVGYLCCILIGFYINAHAETPVLYSLSKFIWILNFYILIFHFMKVRIRALNLLYFLIFAFILPNLYALYGYFKGIDPLTGRNADRILGFISSATYHAHANAVILVFFASLLFFKFKDLSSRMKWIAAFSFALYFLSVILTFTRGIWISLFFSTAIMIAYFNLKKSVYFVIVALMTGLISYHYWPQFQKRIDHSLSTQENSERLNLFKVNVQIFKEYPLFGIGFGENLRRNREYWDRPEWKMPSYYITSHAHNQFLNVLSTTGIFGFLFFCSFYFYFLIKNIILFKKSSSMPWTDSRLLIFTCLWAQIEFFMACLTDVSFEYAKVRTLLLVVWALLLSLEKQINEKTV